MNCSFLHCSSFFQLSRRTVIAKTSLSLNKQGRRRETKKSDFYLFCFRKEDQKKSKKENVRIFACCLASQAGCICLTYLIGIPSTRSVIHLEWNSFFYNPPFSSFKYKTGRYLFSSDFLKEYRNWASG